MIFVKRDRTKNRDDLLDEIIDRIKNVKNNAFCRDNCNSGKYGSCNDVNKYKVGNILSSQGYFDFAIPVNTNNPCFVSTLFSEIKKINEVEETSTIVQICIKEMN